MKHLVAAVEQAVKEKNWYAALSVTLSLPDICGALEATSGRASQSAFVAWFDKHVKPSFATNVGPRGDPDHLLCGSDCYALRCAYLHQGDFDIRDQRARAVLDRVRFIEAASGWAKHRDRFSGVLQLQVDLFCSEVCRAVNEWAGAISDPAVSARIQSLARIDVVPVDRGSSLP